MIVDLFSPFYWKISINEHNYIKSKYISLIEDNYYDNPNNADDWVVHTSYSTKPLKNNIDWSLSLPIYKKYISDFILEYFGENRNFNISGNPWYTTYGYGQSADTHEHLPDHFSVVHFLKFNKEKHNPITFINPNGHFIKCFIDSNKNIKNMIDFNNINQSYFHPRYTPDISEGDLIIFPGQLEHLVDKNKSYDLRTTIAMNINIL